MPERVRHVLPVEKVLSPAERLGAMLGRFVIIAPAQSDFLSQAEPASGARHRKRKKCRPHNEHRYGERSQSSARSIPFRVPTPRNSTDLQFGQRAEDSAM